jgi:hypothetical protein
MRSPTRGFARPASAMNHVHSVGELWNLRLLVSYGLTENVTLGASLPYVKRASIRAPEHIHGAPDEVVDLGASQGLRALRRYEQYRFFRDPKNDANTAFIVGVKVPSGDHDETVRQDLEGDHEHDKEQEAGHVHGRFEAEHQPGSGVPGTPSSISPTVRCGAGCHCMRACSIQ